MVGHQGPSFTLTQCSTSTAISNSLHLVKASTVHVYKFLVVLEKFVWFVWFVTLIQQARSSLTADGELRVASRGLDIKLQI